MHAIKDKWNTIYQNRPVKPSASVVLTENQHLLPPTGTALDLACGQGGNAILLAEHGLDVVAWDISDVAIEQLNVRITQEKLSIDAHMRDVSAEPLKENSFDVVVVSYFLDRDLLPTLINAIKPGGLIFYQTYCQQKVNQQGPSNPDYLLADNELLVLLASMHVRVYREEALLGQHDKGLRNQAMIVAEK